MSTFVYMTRCDGCGHCVDICPSDIMHIDENIRRAKNIEPNFCWECYSCVKACPNHAIDVRGYADFAPMGHSVRVRREEEKGTISWKIKFRNGTEKNFVSPITTKPWGKFIPKLAEGDNPNQGEINSQRLYSEPEGLNTNQELPSVPKESLKRSLLLMAKHKTRYEECDVLVVGGGMAGTGATFEARHWGRDLKIICVEKANIDRSGAVAQGLYAINCYMGMQWNENQPEDHVRYARNDLMGMVREDLGYDMARHVDSTVHMFDEWGLPMMKMKKLEDIYEKVNGKL